MYETTSRTIKVYVVVCEVSSRVYIDNYIYRYIEGKVYIYIYIIYIRGRCVDVCLVGYCTLRE